ncbi:choice-of-anchor Q domain-containing protein [Pedobacter ureilyticus]|uniref:Choice-of-anchor Q domain-containing protein n=1 Tax=Pedobacter ureilyticus TaxID=1393051 RepID=A0ABW9J392_9SPHI|nr:choice-of-anchor Q domain-containing protein [Pedobacter helvus]
MRIKLLFLFVFAICASMVSAQTVIYVDSAATGNNSGNSWTNAYNDLQSALDKVHQSANAGINYEIRLAKGTYTPTKHYDNRYGYVLARGGIKLLGGYNAQNNLRDILANPTLISADWHTRSTPHLITIMSINGSAAPIEIEGLTLTRGGETDYTRASSYFINGKEIPLRGGGAIYITQVLNDLKISRCKFTDNTSYRGAAIGIDASNVSIENSQFIGNYTSDETDYGNPIVGGIQALLQSGGAISINASGILKISRSIFSNNGASLGGAIGASNGSTPGTIGDTKNITINIDNSIFHGTRSNMTMLTGDAKVVIEGSLFVNNISYNNNADFNSSDISISNSIITANHNIGTAAVIRHSIVQGGYSGTNIRDVDPMLRNINDPAGPDGIFGTPDDGLRPIVGSPAINTGYIANNAALNLAQNSKDITGAPRYQDGALDVGPYEGSACPEVIYVDANVTSSGNGRSWQTALKTLHEALAVADNCNTFTTIKVAKGNYLSTHGEGSKDQSLIIKRANLKIEGGYDPSTNKRHIKTNPSILSGNFSSINGSFDKSYHVMMIVGVTAQTDSLIVDGFDITAGDANGDGNRTINNTVVHDGHGGGIFIKDCSNGENLVLRNLTFRNNRAKRFGGALHIINSSPLIDRCVFSNNRTEGINSTGGGALATETSGSPKVVNSVFVNNATQNVGGAIYNSSTTPRIINATFFKNSSVNGANAIYNGSSTNLSIINTLIWSDSNESLIMNNTSSVTASYSNIRQTSGVYPGAGNKNIDPKFVNPNNLAGPDNFLGTADDGIILQATSPLIDAGDNSSIPTSIIADLLGNARIAFMTVDIGAYESTVPSVLPVSFGKFSASLQSNRVKLNWNTISETNNEVFIVYRSTDGKNYTEIAKQNSKGSNANNYIAYDNNPVNGVNYYHLKQRDLDGTTTELGDDVINFSLNGEEIKAWPNPADKWLKLSFTAGKYQNLKLMDISGKKFQERNIAIAQSEMELDLSNYPKGVYLVELNGNKGKHVLKILK